MEKEIQWVQLREVFNDLEGDIVLGALSSGGIPARKREKNPHCSRVIMGQSLGLIIEVPAYCLEEARQLLHALHEAGSEDSD